MYDGTLRCLGKQSGAILSSYFPHIPGMILREFSGVDQPENAASGTPSSSSVWLWMPVSSGRNT